ncbi:type II secretion system F family protein [Leucobacter chinensis]|uniref:type II secretion system F family protein n=1 Tax=Leucobacter chinensis TaxID=2851010 RepID=UPI001C22ED6F
MTREAAVFAAEAASLMRGGMSPRRALTHLAASQGHSAAVASSAIRQGERGSEDALVFEAQEGEQWRLLTAAWIIAERSGAPVAGAFERMAESFSEISEVSRKRRVLLAGPQSTVLLISALPLVALLGGQLLGIDAFAQLATPQGAIAGVVGLLLLVLGVSWGLSMVRSVGRHDHVGGSEAELLAIALMGGAGVREAKRIVVHTVDEAQALWADLDAFAEQGALTLLIERGRESGVSLHELLLLHAAEQRAEGRSGLETAAERLAVKVLVPLGLCVLPSLICLGVIPIMLGLLGG